MQRRFSAPVVVLTIVVGGAFLAQGFVLPGTTLQLVRTKAFTFNDFGRRLTVSSRGESLRSAKHSCGARRALAMTADDDEWISTKVVQARARTRTPKFDTRSSMKGETDWARYSGLSVMGFKGGTITMARAKNQDSVFAGQVGDGSTLFAVFDGHGDAGHEVSQFLVQRVVNAITPAVEVVEAASGQVEVADVQGVLDEAMDELHEELERQKFDSHLSGSTGILLLVAGEEGRRRLIVANVGDCRAIVTSEGWGGKMTTAQLSVDQSPDRTDERQRIEQLGGVVGMVLGDGMDDARVISVEEAAQLNVDLGPARVFFKENEWKPPHDKCFPGLAMSRSLGDSILDELGVVPVPEVSVRDMKPKDRFLVLASDGIWQVLSNEEVAALVTASNGNPSAACEALYNEAKERWEDQDTGPYRDDISVFVIDLLR